MTDAYERYVQISKFVSTGGVVRRRLLTATPTTTTTSPGQTTTPGGGTSPPAPPPPSGSTPSSQTFLTVREGYALRQIYGAPNPPWPPPASAGGFTVYDNVIAYDYTPNYGNLVNPQKSMGKDGSGNVASYSVQVHFLKFDTAGIPDGATLQSASLRLYLAWVPIDEAQRNLIGDWYTWTGVMADWTASVGNDAVAGVPVGSMGVGPIQIPLTGIIPNISRTGMTYIRLGISGGAPSGGTSTVSSAIMAYSGGPSDKAPTLTVQYLS